MLFIQKRQNWNLLSIQRPQTEIWEGCILTNLMKRNSTCFLSFQILKYYTLFHSKQTKAREARRRKKNLRFTCYIIESDICSLVEFFPWLMFIILHAVKSNFLLAMLWYLVKPGCDFHTRETCFLNCLSHSPSEMYIWLSS